MASVYTHTEAFTRRSFYTHTHTHTEAFTRSKLLRTKSFTHSKLFKQRSFCTQKLLHRGAFAHSKRLDTEHFYTECFYTWQAFTHTHTEAFTRRSFYTHTQKLLHTEKLLHAASFYTQNRLHTASFYRKSFYTEKLSCTYDNRNCSSKTGWISAPKQKKNTILKHFLKGILQGKSPAPKLKICWHITIAALMQPLQYDLRCPAAKDTI